jgi:hypothetical protein
MLAWYFNPINAQTSKFITKKKFQDTKGVIRGGSKSILIFKPYQVDYSDISTSISIKYKNPVFGISWILKMNLWCIYFCYSQDKYLQLLLTKRTCPHTIRLTFLDKVHTKSTSTGLDLGNPVNTKIWGLKIKYLSVNS